jgi:spermidine synthase
MVNQDADIVKVEKKVFEQEDEFGRVVVLERDGRRELFLGSEVVQSAVESGNPAGPTLEYIRAMLISLGYPGCRERALVLGVGGGSLVAGLSSVCDGMRIDGVERSSAVLSAATRAMYLPVTPAMNFFHADARDWVIERAGSVEYDYIFLDLFDGDGPSLIYQDLAFCLNVVRLLAEDGVLVVNLWKNTPVLTRSILENLNGEFYASGLKWSLPSGFNLVYFNFRNPEACLKFPSWRQRMEKAPEWPFPGAGRMMRHLCAAYPYHFG